VLDVRTPEEYAESHITNSINIDVLSDYFTATYPHWKRIAPTQSIAARENVLLMLPA